jgi:hypothetical protein
MVSTPEEKRKHDENANDLFDKNITEQTATKKPRSTQIQLLERWNQGDRKGLIQCSEVECILIYTIFWFKNKRVEDKLVGIT